MPSKNFGPLGIHIFSQKLAIVYADPNKQYAKHNNTLKTFPS